jgi:hypothetical protein
VELIVRANLPISLFPLFSTGIFISVWDSLQLEKWQILYVFVTICNKGMLLGVDCGSALCPTRLLRSQLSL